MKHQELSRFGEIKLVASRELRSQLFKKATLISTIFMMIIAAGMVLAVYFFAPSSDVLRVGTNNATALPGLEQIKSSDGESGVKVIQMARPTAEKNLESDDPTIDVFVDTQTNPIEIVSWDGAPSSFDKSVNALAANITLSKEIAKLGGNPDSVNQAVATAAPKIVELKKDVAKADLAQVIASTVMVILLFFMVVGAGGMVAMSVVEEKTSRVVEILLATVRPTSLLAGKVIGAGISSVLTTTLVILSAVIPATATGMLNDFNLNLGTSSLLLLLWIILGFIIYSLLYASAGAMVSRQEDMGQVTLPIMVLVMIPYMISVSLLPNDPGSTLAKYLSYVPFFAPFLAPSRNALGVATTADNLISLALVLITIPLIIWIAGRLYVGAVLRTGERVKLKDAWKGNA
ncbi:ABC transporter permease [Actinomycetaceae bacterium TAE3-ERU4]|nr:ABC transporter permease [Actinomycetaceae bacterium TAE3-ERU4]